MLRGHRLLQLAGKGNKPATMPLTVPVLRILEACRGERPKDRRPSGRCPSGKPIDRRNCKRMVALGAGKVVRGRTHLTRLRPVQGLRPGATPQDPAVLLLHGSRHATLVPRRGLTPLQERSGKPSVSVGHPAGLQRGRRRSEEGLEVPERAPT
jgi:hypothetical protein